MTNAKPPHRTPRRVTQIALNRGRHLWNSNYWLFSLGWMQRKWGSSEADEWLSGNLWSSKFHFLWHYLNRLSVAKALFVALCEQTVSGKKARFVANCLCRLSVTEALWHCVSSCLWHWLSGLSMAEALFVALCLTVAAICDIYSRNRLSVLVAL